MTLKPNISLTFAIGMFSWTLVGGCKSMWKVRNYATVASNCKASQNLTKQCTSRKHGKKELQSFVHCGSFDHPDLQSLNDCTFIFGGFMIAILKFWGHVIHHWKGIFKTFPALYQNPQFPKTSVGKPR
jgi:hypothetical protein